MELGIALPHTGKHASTDAIVQVAQRAEALGYASVWVLERLIRPTAPIPGYGGQMAPAPEVYGTVFEPIDTLSYVAARTAKIKLGTSVMDAIYHVPVALARRFATLDQLSGGRVIAGLGQGSMAPEFEAANIPLSRRGAGFEECIAAMRAAWGPDPVEFKGRFYTIPAANVNPKPVQAGGPPIIIGGFAPAAVERAGRLGFGLNPVAAGWEPVQRVLQGWRAAARAAGHDPDRLLVVLRANSQITDAPLEQRNMLSGSVEQVAADAQRLESELGVHHLFFDLNFAGTPVDRMLQVMEQLRVAIA